MDLILALKFLHVIGAAVLFGTGLGIAFFQFRANRRGEPGGHRRHAQDRGYRRLPVHRHGRRAPARDRAPARASARLCLGQTWIAVSLALYVLIGACWLPVVVLQIRMRDLAEAAVAAGEPALPPRYHRLARVWFWLGWPAFLSMLAIFWLMIAKPA